MILLGKENIKDENELDKLDELLNELDEADEFDEYCGLNEDREFLEMSAVIMDSLATTSREMEYLETKEGQEELDACLEELSNLQLQFDDDIFNTVYEDTP